MLLQLCIPWERSTKVLGNIKIPSLLNSTVNWEDQQRYWGFREYKNSTPFNSTCLCVCVSVCLSVCLPACLGLAGWLSVCLSACLPAWLSVCLSGWLSVCLYMYVHVCTCMYMYVHCTCMYMYVYVCVCMSCQYNMIMIKEWLWYRILTVRIP